MRTVVFIATILLATPASAAEPAQSTVAQVASPTTEQLTLATLVFDAQGDMTPALMSSVHRLIPRLAGNDPAKAAEMEGKLVASYVAHKPELDALRPQLIALWAQAFTPDELRQMAAYYGSPLGKSVAAKALSAVGGLAAPLDLTPDETAARDQFVKSPVGQAVTLKAAVIAFGGIEIMSPVLEKIVQDISGKP